MSMFTSKDAITRSEPIGLSPENRTSPRPRKLEKGSRIPYGQRDKHSPPAPVCSQGLECEPHLVSGGFVILLVSWRPPVLLQFPPRWISSWKEYQKAGGLVYGFSECAVPSPRSTEAMSSGLPPTNKEKSTASVPEFVPSIEMTCLRWGR